MSAINTVNNSGVVGTAVGTLAPELGSAAFGKLDGYNHDAVSAGHTVQVMKSRGANARLPHSMAVEVPEFTAAHVAEAVAKYPVLVDAFISTLYAAQREILIGVAASGRGVVQYSEITLASVAASMKPAVRSVKLSGDAIRNWYQVQVADVMAVAIAERLGVGETPSDEDMVRIGQVSNQVRDNLAKLAAPAAANNMDDRVRKSLQWALDSIVASGLDDSGMVERLDARLNPAVAPASVNLADMLGI